VLSVSKTCAVAHGWVDHTREGEADSVNIYIMGICGTGTGALAGLLKQQGHHVTGSDAHIYPPMSDKLREWGIGLHEGYAAEHLQPHPDLVVVGNVIRADNPEARYAREANLTTLSMPQAVARFGIGDKHSIVVAGTHGKTTTSALLTHVLLHAGCDPSYLVGGALVDYPESFRAGSGNLFVVEGDEYDTAYFDKGPKFVHYRPRTAIITSLEFDHADIFANVEAVEAAFGRLVAKVPADGRLVVWQGATRARQVIAAHPQHAPVTVYAATPAAAQGADLYAEDVACNPEGIAFTPVLRGRSMGPMTVPLWGDFSVCNALAVIAALEGTGLDDAAIRSGLASFGGVRRRMEVRGAPAGVTVVDDFAHHPTAVQVTLAAARSRWPQRRIWAVFEPRSATSRRNVFQSAYVEAFAPADAVVIAGHPRLAEIDAAHRFDPEALAAALRATGRDARHMTSAPAIAAHIAGQARSGDVVMVLSNGDFDGLHGLLLAELTARAGGAAQSTVPPAVQSAAGRQAAGE
jgi:UDP-N-acetylmuramate: L-alanyl-gamma-D-glutamyl-meso-diaminopimelate ligase